MALVCVHRPFPDPDGTAEGLLVGTSRIVYRICGSCRGAESTHWGALL